MKKLLLIAILMLALVFTVVACTTEKTPEGTTAGETTAADAPAQTTAEPDADTTAADAPADTTAEPDADTTAADAPADTTAEPVVTTEPETTADPADPVWIIDADGLAAMTNVNAATVEKNEAGYASFTATGGDPWFLVTGNIGAMPEYMVMSYRTNTAQTGEFFIGNGAGPEGGKSFVYNYNANSEWNLLVFHLPTVASYMTDNTVGHIRFDFYTGGPEEGAFLDVEFIAFFNTAEYAEAYFNAAHPAFIEKEAAGMTAHSFDTFKVNGEMYFEQDGQASDKLDAINNTVSFGVDEVVENIALRGWIGFGQAIEAFGYYIDNPYAQTFGEFKAATEDAVIGIAGEHATRFEIIVPVADLSRGAHKIGFVVKLADGTVARLRTEITIVIPTHYDNYNVPQDQWVITGHNTNLNDSSNGMVAAGGVESAALLHQGSIYVGDLDLSKYSKVVVMWGCDNSQVTIDHYNANANNRIMLLNAVMDGVMSPAEETIIAGGTYELKGWAVTAFEIDLTNVDYNGPVYVAIDALPGTFALISSVEFIGAKLPFEAPEHTDETIALGVRGNGGPFSGSDKTFGQRFNIGDNFLKNITVTDMATYDDGNVNKWSVKVWQWDTDYATTVAGEPLYVVFGENHANCTSMVIDIPATVGILGDFYYEVEYLEGAKQFTGWKAEESVAEGVETYVSGNKVDGTYSSTIVVGVPVTEDAPVEPETPDEPTVEYYENLAIAQDQWVISGHNTQLNDTTNPMVAAGGVESAALLHQGSIALGEIDLSKYSKVVIYWGSDASQVTIDAYNANANNRFALVNADKNMKMSPDEETIIVAKTYELHGWAVQAFEIDLTGIDYNGPVFLTHDSLPGGFALVSSIEFIGAEITAEPEA